MKKEREKSKTKTVKKNDASTLKTQEATESGVAAAAVASAPIRPPLNAVEVENSLVEIIRRSAYYDETWYKSQYNDLGELDIDFARHYMKYGWQEGKAPSFNFSGKLYLEAYNDVANRKINPLIHYELRGLKENRRPFSFKIEAVFSSKYFDSEFYCLKHGLDRLSRFEAVIHYLESPELDAATSRYFNPSLYLAAYSDVRAAGVHALLHYELHGRKEKRTSGISNIAAKFQSFEDKSNIDQPATRICLFACYSADGTFSDETVYLLEEVRKVTDCIILFGDCGISEEAYNKVRHLVYYANFERHLEYDFGSYKRAFAYAESAGLLSDATEILVCNDSIVGPCGDLNQFFRDRERDGDPKFYGITVNNYGFRNTASNGNSLYSPHIQSYFFTITREIFESSYWRDFIYSVKSHENKIDIIMNYEMGMSKLLEANGHPPHAMYKSRVGLNPAALEPEDVLTNALFIKKSIVHKLSSKRAGVINGIFKAKGFPFELRGDYLAQVTGTAAQHSTPSKGSKLKVVDCEIVGSNVLLFAVCELELPSLELLISSDNHLLKIPTTPTTSLNNGKYLELTKNYLQRSLHTHAFSFSITTISSGASLNFINDGRPVPIEYIYGNLPCHNFMKHRELNLYPRIENKTLYLATKDQAILAIMLSDNYSNEDKQLFIKILKSTEQLKYNLFSERSSLACDNAYEAFKYSLNQDANSFYITSKATISTEKDPKIKRHMVEFGSTKHRELLLSAKNLFCSFGFPGIMSSNLKDIHITALRYKLHLMWHGISAGDKNSYEIAAFNGNSSDSVLACSAFEVSNFKRLGHNNVYLTGYPRMDKWANENKLDPNGLILFFTWRRSLLHSSLAEFLESEYVKIIKDLVARITNDRPDMNMYYFIHNSVPAKHAEILAANLRSISPNIRFVNNTDQSSFNKLFNSAQYMITDYSSVGYDFAYFKKRSPIFYMPDSFISGHYSPTSLFAEIQPGVQAVDLDTIIKALKPSEFKKHRSAVKKFFPFSDGDNCKRSLEKIEL